jgi:membrane protein
MRLLLSHPALTTAKHIAWRTAKGVAQDGSLHAGNLAYITLLALFPFVIIFAALAHVLEANARVNEFVNSLLNALPAQTAHLLAKPIHDVLHARTGSLLWIGALVGLWTVAGYIEAIRDIIRTATKDTSPLPFWRTRIRAIAISVAAVLLIFFAFSSQILITAVEQFITHLFPLKHISLLWKNLSFMLPIILTFLANWLLFWLLEPEQNKGRKSWCWPGALLAALYWAAVVRLLPIILVWLQGYSMTYGGLASVMFTLLFFWQIGFGQVVAIYFNVALCEFAFNRVDKG